jgi:hypothetical protein
MRRVLASALLAVALPALADNGIRVVEEAGGTSAGKTLTATTTIDAPVDTLCRIVQDYGAYGTTMPNTKSAVPVASGDGWVLVDMTLDLPLGQEKRYRLRLEPRNDDGTCRLTWQLVPRPDLRRADTIADTRGYWLFTPVPGDARSSAVVYHVYADPGPVPYGFGWIVDMMSKRSLPRTLEAVRERAMAMR